MAPLLYYDLISQPSRAIFMFLKKEGIKFDSKVFDLFKGEHKTAEYKKINPLQSVPFLVDEKIDFPESAAIFQYLIEKFKKQNWLGSDIVSRTRVTHFLHWHHTGLRKHCVDVFLAAMGFKPETEGARENVTKAVDYLEKRFLTEGKTNKKFIGGAKLSMADIMAYTELQQLSGVLEEGLYTKNAKVKAWMDNVEKEIGAAIHKEASVSIVATRKSFEAKAKGASQQKGASSAPMLYYDLISQPSRAIFMFLKKEGIKFDSKVFDLFKGEHKNAEYKKVNEDQTVPFLVDEGSPFGESAAIFQYLIEKYQKTSWLGSDIVSRTRVTQFLHWHHQGLRKHCVDVFLAAMGFKPETEGARENVTKAVDCLEKRFLTEGKANKKFIGGANISFADLMAYAELQQLSGVLEEGLYTKNAKVKAWMDNVEKELGAALHKEASVGIVATRKNHEAKAKGGSKK